MSKAGISERYFGGGLRRIVTKPGLWFFVIALFISFYVGKNVTPTFSVERVTIDAKYNAEGQLTYTYKKKQKAVKPLVNYENSVLRQDKLAEYNANNQRPPAEEEYVVKSVDGQTEYMYYTLKKHWGFYSLIPALVAIVLCWLVKEPITALMGGIISGAFLLGQYDIVDSVIIPRLTTTNAASVLVLYLLLLGGILGIWSRTGAAQAFADLMAKNFVRGPKSAKIVAWVLGIIFHQGGTMSTVLVGTTVKPLSDKEGVSHEELSYIVDSTASPIAALLPFNAWPGYVQAFIFVSGVGYLATEKARTLFFFQSIPISFYAIFAVLFTFLISLELLPEWVMGKKMTAAMKRAKATGELDHPDSEPLSSKELTGAHSVPKGYNPHVSEFFIPIAIVMGVSMGTFIVMDSPQIRWAFAIALIVAWAMALLRGMRIKDLMMGMEDGLKGVVVGAVILLLAMTIGGISKDAGGGIFLVELLGNSIPFWLLPIMLQLLTMVISFSTGTSWGTYAVAFPLAIPLAIAVGAAQGVANPEFYTLICFATVLNGSLYGDQCSPISDTTVLSSMVSGCDLMDHVTTQIVPASVAAGLGAILWTLLAFIAA